MNLRRVRIHKPRPSRLIRRIIQPRKQRYAGREPAAMILDYDIRIQIVADGFDFAVIDSVFI